MKGICVETLKLISSVHICALPLILKKQLILQRLFYIKTALIKIYNLRMCNSFLLRFGKLPSETAIQSPSQTERFLKMALDLKPVYVHFGLQGNVF